MDTIGLLLVIALLACSAPAGWMYYDHLARSAQRLPAPSLALQARVCRWLVAVAALASLLGLAANPLHMLPRPAMPGAWHLTFTANVLLAGTDLLHPGVLSRLLIALTTLSALAVLVQFPIAFAGAVRTSKQPRRT